MTFPVNLTASVDNLGAAATAMTEEIRTDRERRAGEHEELVRRYAKQYRGIMVLLVVVVALVAALIVLGVTNRQLYQRIESCTVAGGDCYKESQKRTGAAVDQIARLLLEKNIIVTWCAREAATEAELRACVEERAQMPSEAQEPPPSGTGPDGEPVPEPQPAPTN